MSNTLSADRSSSSLVKSDRIVFFVLLLLGLLLYIPVLNKGLLSDDFLVMKRVGLDKVIFIKGFFRPLSDITLYFNYWMGGFEGIYYNCFNLLLHVTGSFFIYLFCNRWEGLPLLNRNHFAFLTALLFLTYPFHNESVVWGVGRASLLAGFFGISALLVTVSKINPSWKLIWANLFYFIGLSAYESIFLLPIPVLLVLWSNKIPFNKIIVWASSFAFTLLVHIITRKLVAGGMLGGYAEGLFNQGIQKYLSNFFKIGGRLFLPPSDNSSLLTVSFLTLLLGLLILIAVQIRRRRSFRPAFLLIVFLLVSLVVPVSFGVSTRTSESDRLLYFPSVFVCLLVAFFVTELISSRKWLFAVSILLLLYYITFLELNNQNWRKGSDISKEVLHALKEKQVNKETTLLLNVPDEYNGAFIFRIGFEDALIINGLDTSKIKRLSRLKWEDYKTIPDEIVPEQRGDTLFIAPQNRIVFNRPGNSILIDSAGVMKGPYPISENEVWYWDKKELKSISLTDK